MIVGLFDSTTGHWALLAKGGSRDEFVFGKPGSIPITGDWDCDGIVTAGTYSPENGFVELTNDTRARSVEVSFYIGVPGDTPLAGDWDGDGCDTVSVYRPMDSTIHVSNRLQSGPTDFSFGWLEPIDMPLSGDFDGDGVTDFAAIGQTWTVITAVNPRTGFEAEWPYSGRAFASVASGDWNENGFDTLAALRIHGKKLSVWNSLENRKPDNSFRVAHDGNVIVALSVGD